jgi:beta-galactosidase
MRTTIVLAFLLVFASARTASAGTEAHVVHDERGYKLVVDGTEMMVRGMNWGYSPIGTNYTYSLWSQSDEFIERALRRDMELLRAMGINMIRQYADVPPRWVAWIHKNYGIYTMINHTMGRYGATIDGVWIAQIDYANPGQRAALIADIVGIVERYKGTPGVALWLLGNENNYGLAWTSFEAEALPTKAQEDEARADALYSLYGEAITAIKLRDPNHPVAIANGDLQYIDLIAKHCKNLDILGSNVYRGKSARDFFAVIETKLGVPALFTEFGADAYNAKHDHEDATAQAEYLRAQWQEIYEQSWGKGGTGNAIGGFIFQWTDGWWKHKQEENLDVHDTTASWPNDAYPHDHVPGRNNMNEEWFGIAAIEDQDADGFYHVQPRVAYYLLKKAFQLDPYAESTTPEEIKAHFTTLHAQDFAAQYEGMSARSATERMSKIRVSGLRMRLESNVTGADPQSNRNADPRFDHTESLFVDITVRPTPKITAKATVNLVGNASQNRLDPLYWENRTPRVVPDPMAPPPDPDAPAMDPSTDHVSLYGAELEADLPGVGIEAFYRVGHGHWGYEGDFFGIFREAYYGTAIDTYHATAPLGAVLSGKGALDDVKLALGPELYWGANPSAIGKWSHAFEGGLTLTAVHQEDVAERSGAATSSAGYEPLTRRTAIAAKYLRGRATLDVGGLFAAPQRVGREYTFAKEAAPGGGYLGSGYDVYTGRVAWADTLGTRARIAFDGGFARWYVEGNYRGLVADAGADQTITFTGWSMKSSGRGNQVAGLGGVLLTFGELQVAPNVLYQRPLVGPAPAIGDQFDPSTGMYYPGVSPRDAMTDPFVVLENRETAGAEVLFIWDPTPATWYWSWDRDRREDARFAGHLDLVYRHQPTSRDATLIILADGSQVPSGATPPKHDVWNATFAWFTAALLPMRLSGTVYAGQDQANAGDPRLVTRVGGSVSLVRNGLLASMNLKLRDWGPYDYHRDFNLTYPFQWYGDLSYGLPRSAFGIADGRLGVRGQVRVLDGYSEGYVTDLGNPRKFGSEAEVLSYVEVRL